ncbi:hypothetical protein B0H21DRAFT_714127, partial [Amylocystis lapponica]
MSETQPQDYFTTPEPSEWNTVSTSNAGSPPSHFIAPVDATVAEGVSEGLLPSQTVFSPSLQPSSLHSPLPETNLWNSWLSSHDMTATMGSSTGDPPFDSLHASEPTYRIQNQHSLPSLPNPSTYTPTAVGVLGPADANTNTPESILDLYERGELKARVSTRGFWELCCPDCNTWVKTGFPRSLPTLTSPTHFTGLHAHIGSATCQRNSRKAGNTTRYALSPIPVPSTNTPMPARRATTAIHSFSAHTAVENSEPVNLDPLLLASSSRSVPLDTTFPAPPHRRCRGIEVHWPADIGTMNATFPWHRIGDIPDSLSFYIEVLHDLGQTAIARSKLCSRLVPGNECCADCATIPKRVEDVARLARDAKPHTRHVLLNVPQLRQRLQKEQEEVRSLRLE